MEHNYYWNNYACSNSNLLFISKVKMNEQINKKFLSAILILIFVILISAFIIEYKLGHQPCRLCIYERIPYFLSALLIIKILFIKKYDKITLLILSLLFIASAVLAFYHFGIEQGFFDESLVCTSNNQINDLTKEELIKELQKEVISCKDVQFTLLGLSLATINTIISFILSVTTIKLFLDYEKNK